MMRGRTRLMVLEFLVLLGILISGTRTADVVAKADDMAKRIEEESKKVEDQSNVIASEIEARSKTIEDASQEKKFEEASKHVDNVMDEGEKEVDDRANFADELENQADKRVEELGKKIEETSNRNGLSRKRRAVIKGGLGTKKTTSGTSGKRRMTVSYPVVLPHEESAGEQIEEAMKDSEPKIKNEDEGAGKDVEHPLAFSGPQDFSDHSNSEAEEAEDVNYQSGETAESFSEQQEVESSQENENKGNGKVSSRHDQPKSVSESQEFSDVDGNESGDIDATRQDGDTEKSSSDSLNFSDEQEDVSQQNINENGDIENVMVIKQKEPAINFSEQQEDEDTGEDVTAEHVSKPKDKENNEDTVVLDSVSEKHDDDKNDEERNDSVSEIKRPLTEKSGKDDSDEHDGAVYDVDVYQENSNSSSNATKLDHKETGNGTMEGSSTTSSGEDNHTQSEYSTQQPKISANSEGKYNPPVEINLAPSVQLLKPDQKLLNEIEEDEALRLKQKKKKQRAKELQDLGTTQLEKGFDTRWRQLNDENDPEMILRYPSLGKVIGKTGTNQKVSTITPGEVDFLQTEYPDYMKQHDSTNRHKVELIVRDAVGYKRRGVPKGKAKKSKLKKLLIKN